MVAELEVGLSIASGCLGGGCEGWIIENTTCILHGRVIETYLSPLVGVCFCILDS